ncbi:hypothetical protein BJ742DRAFT_379702 [Cladochytrium replicatum]|nr:hypothetical protein BJ742DRAFT_379702 [Cladochytrium replicatum]
MKVIPKNTCILVSRRPASRPGRGTAQRYVNSTMPASMLSKHAGLAPPPPGSNMMPGMVGGGAGGSISAAGAPERMKTSLDNTKSSTVTEAEDQEAEAPVNENMTEEERISAMFQATEKHWEQQQKKMENQRPVMGQNFRGRGTGRGGYFPRGGGQGGPGAFPHQGGAGGAPSDNGYQNDPNMPQRAPPPGYVCFRCGQKGHYINNCPTLGDKDFNRPRLKRTTGIPRIFLKTVEGSATGGAPGAAGPGEGGVMVTQNGDLVVAQPNELAWNKLKGVASQSSLGSTDLYEHIPVPKELECPLCKRLLRDAVLSPCCGASFCDECKRNECKFLHQAELICFRYTNVLA